MKGKTILLFILCAFISISCVEKINNQMHEKVASKDHDERLFGWWQIPDDDTYIFFDNVDFKMFYGRRNYKGELEKEATSFRYWFTENNERIHHLTEATTMTGIIEYSYEYKISDDGEMVYDKIDGNYRPYLQRTK